MGYSCDWDRLRFTMDENNCRAVRDVFVKLYKKGYIYRGDRIVNWCPHCKTSISDAEVDFQENHSFLWHMRYKIENSIKFEDYLDLAEAYKLMKGDNYTTGLKAATEEQNVDTAGLWHTAFDDANNTGKLLKKLVEDGWTPESYFEKIKEVK